MIIVTEEEENHSYKTEFIEKCSGFCFMFKKTFRSPALIFFIVEIKFIGHKIFYFKSHGSIVISLMKLGKSEILSEISQDDTVCKCVKLSIIIRKTSLRCQ